MIGVTVTVRGGDEIVRSHGKFANQFPRMAGTINKQLAEFMAKRARERAPKGVTRDLADSIKVSAATKINVRLRSESPYSVYQEEGFTPHLVSPYLHPELLEWFQWKTGRNPPWLIRVSKSTSFMRPAFWDMIKKSEQISQKEMRMALLNSGFKVS